MALIGNETIGIWIAAILTLAIYSFLYKDNPAYKLAEHIFVGMTAGYTLCIAYYNVLQPNLINELFSNHNYWVLIPAFLGLLMFSRFFSNISWISRIPISFVIGVGAGISIPYSVQGSLMKQSSSTITPLITGNMSDIWHIFTFADISNILILLGVISVLFYFFFSIEQNKGLKYLSKIGIIYLMIFFGASFGYTVMGRVSLVIGRIRFLLVDWLGPFIGLS